MYVLYQWHAIFVTAKLHSTLYELDYTWNEDLQNISDKIIAFYVDKNTFVNTK